MICNVSDECFINFAALCMHLLLLFLWKIGHLDKVYSLFPTHRKMDALGRHYLLHKDMGTVSLIRKPDLTN